jgi:FAD:protein FMN transferase
VDLTLLSPLHKACAAVALLLLAGCTSLREDAALRRFEFEQPQMGVPFRVVLYAPDSQQAEAAANAAFQRIEQLNAIMSDYETDSELSVLSRTSEEGSPEVRVSPDLWTVLERAQRLARQTEGAFDITVGPCVALWRKARREQQLPDPARLQNARAKIGYENLILNDKTRTARLIRRGMRLDLGAIAKGYAADEALKVLRVLGFARAFVAASGDLALGDPPPGETGWRVEIVGYDDSGGPPAGVTLLANHGIATSGDLFQRVEINGVRYSHILDPRTCIGLTNHALATVIARDCMTADALATASTILPQQAALDVAADYKAAVRIVSLENGAAVVVANSRFPLR